jgi:multiple antibiotic resistance protein
MTLEAVLQAFITLFVIANLLPTLPTVLDQTSHLNRSKARGLRFEALAIANLLVLLFAIGGPSVFEFVGVSIDDLRVAGGAILLTFATYDLLFSRAARTRRAAESDEEDDGDPESGIVPLGIPIMVGPATLVTALVVFQSYGEIVGTIAWTLNLLINMVLLFAGEAIVRVIGPAYSKAFAKIMSLLLATIAVAMIRVGIQGMLAAS